MSGIHLQIDFPSQSRFQIDPHLLLGSDQFGTDSIFYLTRSFKKVQTSKSGFSSFAPLILRSIEQEKSKHSLDIMNIVPPADKYSLDIMNIEKRAIMNIMSPAEKHVILSIWDRQWKERPCNDVDTIIVSNSL